MGSVRRAGWVCLLVLWGCGADAGADPKPDPGTRIALAPSAQALAEHRALREAIAEGSGLDADGLIERFSVRFSEELGYDPRTAEHGTCQRV